MQVPDSEESCVNTVLCGVGACVTVAAGAYTHPTYFCNDSILQDLGGIRAGFGARILKTFILILNSMGVALGFYFPHYEKLRDLGGIWAGFGRDSGGIGNQTYILILNSAGFGI